MIDAINQPQLSPVTNVTVGPDHEQRLDNFLLATLKGVPKSLIYKKIRKGEVRVNKKRAKVHQVIVTGDVVRIPPLARPSEKALAAGADLTGHIIFENDELLVMNKPSGLAVHAGSGIAAGVVERLRLQRPDIQFLELAHRIDRETSGCLLLAKKRSVLKALHEAFANQTIKKSYVCLVEGDWAGPLKVNAPLLRTTSAANQHHIKVHPDGKPSETHFKVLERFGHVTLMQASPLTGRTHQIRIHAAYMGHPLVGDQKYNRLKNPTKGPGRLFLHAATLKLPKQFCPKQPVISAKLTTELSQFLAT